MNDSAATIDGRMGLSCCAPSTYQLAMGLILLAAAVLRFGQLNVQSLSMDEVNDLRHTVAGWQSINDYEDRFPPLFYLLENVWLRAVPWDHTGHAFAAVCGLLTVAAAGALGKCMGGPTVGLWSAGLTAAAPLAVRYALESRAYGLYLLLVTAALWQYMEALAQNRPRHWVGFVVFAAIGAYVHYYTGIFIALAGAFLLVSRRPGATLRRGLLAFTALGVACLPVLWLLAHDLAKPWGYARTSEFSPVALAYTYFSYLSGYTLGPSLRQLHVMPAREAGLAAAPWLAVLALITASLSALALKASSRQDRSRLVLWLTTFCLAPAPLIGVLARVLGLGYNIRHVVWASIPLLVVLAIGAARGRPRWLAAASVTALTLSFGIANFNRVAVDEHRNEDVRSAAARIIATHPNRPVYLMSGYMIHAMTHYLPTDWPLEPLPDPADNDDAPQQAVEQIEQALAPGEDFWLVYAREFHGDPQGSGLEALTKTFDLKLDSTFAGVRLYSGQAPLAQPPGTATDLGRQE